MIACKSFLCLVGMMEVKILKDQILEHIIIFFLPIIILLESISNLLKNHVERNIWAVCFLPHSRAARDFEMVCQSMPGFQIRHFVRFCFCVWVAFLQMKSLLVL